MSSPEVEQFEVTDYDLENEFTPRRHRQSKNQATYGIWADKDSDDDDFRPGFGGGRAGKKQDTAPIGFILGEVIKRKDNEGNEVDDGSETDEEDMEVNPERIMKMVQEKKEREIKNAAEQSQRASSNRQQQFSSQYTDRKMGTWEKHTKGIGQKLLLKMGYESGKGLGKEHQGITAPVEAVLRKGRAAVGAYGTERSERSLKDYPVQDKDEEEEKSFKEQLSQWKRKPEANKKKPKYVYKTAQEVIDKSGGRKKKTITGESAKVKVIDMTGKEQKVMKGYHSISTRHDRPEEDDYVDDVQEKDSKKVFDVPELMHNLNLLCDLAEEDIIKNDRKIRYEKDQIVNMKYERDRTTEICDKEDKCLDRLQKVLDIVEMCEQRTKVGCDNPLTLDDCAILFRDLRNNHYEEYKMYDLESLAIALVFPLMKEFFVDWDPLREPEHGISTIREWRYLLEDSRMQPSQDMTDMDTYQRLIWDVWLPIVRKVILNWQARNSDSLTTLLGAWKPVLPIWIMENIQDQLVLPRLLQEVESWNPLTDTTPIHAWLHPWLPLMADKLEPLYAPIRHKLANALNNWHPSDSSAKVILMPWVGVFKQGHMEAFLAKNILPKLAILMQEFVINPPQQILDQWHWMVSWKGLIPTGLMVSMLLKTFFPKWLQVLCSWLGNMPNYEEITKWYMGWKGQFPEEFLSHPQIKEQFTRALDLMNRAVSGHFQPGAKENMAYFAHTEKRQLESQLRTQPVVDVDVKEEKTVRISNKDDNTSIRFKDIVMRKAEEQGILCVPIQGKTHEANQVYKFGAIMVYFDRNVVFAYQKQQWVPVSLQNLLALA